MRKTSLAAFAFLAAAIVVLTSQTDAKAQLFGGRSKVVVNNASGGPVAVRVQENRGLFGGRGSNVTVNNGFQQVQVQQNRGGPVRRLIGGIFNRQQVTEVNVGQPAFVRQNFVAVNQHHQFNAQLIRQRNVVFQSNNLNTFSYAHNNVGAIRFVQAQHHAYVQPAQIVAPVQVQRYAVQIPAPVIVQEVTQPCPQCEQPAAPQVIPPAAQAPTAGDPSVQYSTAPQRVIQRSVVVQRPLAVTGGLYYVQSAPVRVRQFVQTDCGGY